MRLAHAEELLQNGQFKEALQQVQSAQQTDPDNKQIQTLYEKITFLKKEEDVMNRYMENKMYKNALGHIDAILTDVNKCARFKLLKAECFAHLNEFDKAEDLLKAMDGIQESVDTKMDMTYIRALILFNGGDIKKAFDTAKAGMDIDKSHTKVKQVFFRSKYLQNQMDEAEKSVAAKNYQHAKTLYNEVVETISEDNKSGEYNRVLAKILKYKAETSLKMQAYIDAIADYERIINYGEFLDEAYACLADAHIATGGLDLASRVLKKSIDNKNIDEKTRAKILAKVKEIESKKINQQLQHMLKKLKSSKTPHEMANLEADAQAETVRNSLQELLDKHDPAQYADQPDYKRTAEDICQRLRKAKEEVAPGETGRKKLQDINPIFESMNSWKNPRQAAGLKDDATKRDAENIIKKMIKIYHGDNYPVPEDKQKADEVIKKLRHFQNILKNEK